MLTRERAGYTVLEEESMHAQMCIMLLHTCVLLLSGFPSAGFSLERPQAYSLVQWTIMLLRKDAKMLRHRPAPPWRIQLLMVTHIPRWSAF